MSFPFEVPFEKVQSDIDTYVDIVFGALQSEFLTLPKGEGFVEYPVFEKGYEALKLATNSFRDFSAGRVVDTGRTLMLRTIAARSRLC